MFYKTCRQKTYSFVHTRIQENKKRAQQQLTSKKTFSLAHTEKVKSQVAAQNLFPLAVPVTFAFVYALKG
jgi:hypothetical protein